MRKRIVGSAPPDAAAGGQPWLDLDELAEVEISSEDIDHPIESALLPGGTSGWRAAGPGPQTIRLRFARPQRLRRIWLHIIEAQVERTQEYVLRWSGPDESSVHDIVRQQWTFSPGGATSQIQDHQVDLPSVSVLELTIVPDIGGGSARASLAQLRLA